ncbi:hypothetical protein BHM03_00020067 [Ensete ventricosum]|nr:hypothetical protein BHM03_00020067 [Ensete ventricosum]
MVAPISKRDGNRSLSGSISFPGSSAPLTPPPPPPPPLLRQAVYSHSHCLDDQRRKKKKKLPVGGHAESTCLVPSLPPPSQDPISVSRRPKVSDLWSPHTPSLISLSLFLLRLLSRDLGFEFEFEIRVFTSRSGFLLDPGVESASPAVEGWFLIHRRRHPDLYCDGGHGGPEPVSRVHDAGRRAPLGRGRRRGIGQAADFHLS